MSNWDSYRREERPPKEETGAFLLPDLTKSGYFFLR